MEGLVAAQLVSGGDWPEEFNLRTLNAYLDGPARKYFDKMKADWAAEPCTVANLINKMLEVYIFIYCGQSDEITASQKAKRLDMG